MGALPGLCPRKREAEALHSTGVSALLSPRAAREAPESAESRSGHGAPGEPGFPGAGLREREGRRGVWACGGAPQGGWVQGAGSAPGVEGAGGGGAPGKGRGRRARAGRPGWVAGARLGWCSPITPAEGSPAAGVLGCQEPLDRNVAGAGG